MPKQIIIPEKTTIIPAETWNIKQVVRNFEDGKEVSGVVILRSGMSTQSHPVDVVDVTKSADELLALLVGTQAVAGELADVVEASLDTQI